MGEARRKLEADASGVPRPRDNRCPSCGSHRVQYVPPGDRLARLTAQVQNAPDAVELAVCRSCSALWEPHPPVYVRDPVCAEPCDNCAFRPGSPEQQDSERWRELLRSLKPESPDDWHHGRFYCHKDVPIDTSQGPGNFLFPQRPVLDDDGQPVRDAEGKVATIPDQSKMRVCSGFLRMVWAHHRKTKGRAE